MSRQGLGCGALLGLLWVSRVAGATTIAGGSLAVDTVWTAANSPYAVQGDFTVPSGKTLTIQPGVEVQFGAGDTLSAGLDATRTELTINGTLLAEGSVASPIVFHVPGATGISGWYGVVAGATASSVLLSHVEIENGLHGVESRAPGGVVSLSSSTLTHNAFAVWVRDGSITMDSLLITGNTVGVQALDMAADVTFVLSNCVLSSNSGAAVVAVGSSGHTTQGTIESSTFHANGGDAIQVLANANSQSSVTIRNSILSSNVGDGIDVLGGGTGSATITYSDVWGNGTAFNGAAAGTGCISANPLYVAAPTDLQLTAASPCRDIGSATGAPQHDLLGAVRPQGTGYELGAYEYPAGTGGTSSGGAGGTSSGGTGGVGTGSSGTAAGGLSGASAGSAAGGASAGSVGGHSTGVAGGTAAGGAGSGGEPASDGSSADAGTSASGATNQAGGAPGAGASDEPGAAGTSPTAAAAPSSSSGSGCSCAVDTRRTNTGLWLSLALLLFAVKRRTRSLDLPISRQ